MAVNVIAGTAAPRIECWLRDSASPGVHDRQAAVYDRLERYESEGRIAELNVDVWGRRVRRPPDGATDEDGLGSDLWAVYRAFESWAERTGHELAPAFRRRKLASLVDDVEGDVVVLPIVCLAVYDDDALRAVVPCSTPDGVVTVEDCLAALEEGAAPEPMPEDVTDD